MKTRVVHHSSPVEWLVVRPTVRIAANATLAEAGELMGRANVSALLVGAGPEAIVTERDVSRAIGAGYRGDATVAEVATPNPVVVPGTTPVVEAAAVMLNEDVRHLVVELGDAEQGVVSMRAVTAVLLSSADHSIWLRSLRLNVSNVADLGPDSSTVRRAQRPR
jgi:CBS domain-containing protein